jgi:DNA-binding Xre family transcriptional regulator
MEITLKLDDKFLNDLNKIREYYDLKNFYNNDEKQTSLDELVKVAVSMYLKYLMVKPEPLIENDHWVIKTKIQNIFKEQKKNQTAVSKITGISSSTLSNIWNGSVPTLENFIRIWIALGRPPIETLLDIETTVDS